MQTWGTMLDAAPSASRGGGERSGRWGRGGRGEAPV